MSDRFPAKVTVDLLLRRTQAAGGFAMVLEKGDPQSGMLLVLTREKGTYARLLELVRTLEGPFALQPAGPSAEEGEDALAQYIARRRRGDPDLWVMEIDIADPERFAAETIGVG